MAVKNDEVPSLVDFDTVPEQMQDCRMFEEYLDRLSKGKDMRVIVSATDSETGVGKTVAAVWLAKLFDIHGYDAEEKGTLNTREFLDTYNDVQKGSAMHLEEAEDSGDRRRAMSEDTVNLGYAFAKLRYKQVFGILSLPDKNVLDDRLVKLCDYWLLVKERGKAHVYKIVSNDFNGRIHYQRTDTLYVPDLTGDADYEEMENKKQKHVEGEVSQKYVHVDEFEEAKKNWYNKFRKQTRYYCLKGIYDYMDENFEGRNPLSQEELGNAIGKYDDDLALSQQMVGKIVNSDSFEDFYSS